MKRDETRRGARPDRTGTLRRRYANATTEPRKISPIKRGVLERPDAFRATLESAAFDLSFDRTSLSMDMFLIYVRVRNISDIFRRAGSHSRA